jgi:hypothetical protein
MARTMGCLLDIGFAFLLLTGRNAKIGLRYFIEKVAIGSTNKYQLRKATLHELYTSVD